MIDRIHCNTVPTAPMNVKVVNGNVLICDTEVKIFSWWTPGYTFQIDAKVIPIGAYDLILGMDWLEQFRPMNCDWLEKLLEFDYHVKRIKVQGLLPSDQATLKEISGEELLKMQQGNDLWAAVLIAPVQDNVAMKEQYLLNGIPIIIQSLIHEHGDLFQAPTELPPSRVYDYSIALLPNSIPVNSRPYRYSPDQKTEIERQVTEMLKSGVVVPALAHLHLLSSQ